MTTVAEKVVEEARQEVIDCAKRWYRVRGTSDHQAGNKLANALVRLEEAERANVVSENFFDKLLDKGGHI